MAVSVIDIANLALAKLGADVLTSLSEPNDRAEAFNAIFEHTRDAILEEHQWRFAIKRAELAVSLPAPEYEFTNAFALPPDNLRVLGTDDDTLRWTLEGGRLLSDRGSMKITYIAKITDTTKWSPLFVEAIAERMAAELALPITGRTELKDFHWNLYLAKVREARTRDSQVGTPPQFGPDDLIVHRFS